MTVKKTATTPKPTTLRLALSNETASEFNKVREASGVSDAKLRTLVARSVNAHLRGTIGTLVLADLTDSLSGV